MPLLLKTVEASRGPRWIGDAFRLFARRPTAFTAMTLVFFAAAMLVRGLPLLGALLPLMALPLLSLGFMVAAQSALLDGPVHPRQFIEPLRTDAPRRRALITLCLSYAVVMVVTLLLADSLSDGAWAKLQKVNTNGPAAQAQIEALLPQLGLGALVLGVLASLVSVPYWHAPALVHWGGQGVKQALFSSVIAVWRTRGAFFTYTVAWLGLMLLVGMALSIVLQLLGLQEWASVLSLPAMMVLSAVFYISVLFTFNDSFGGAMPEPA
jgi:hypothetical protein